MQPKREKSQTTKTSDRPTAVFRLNARQRETGAVAQRKPELPRRATHCPSQARLRLVERDHIELQIVDQAVDGLVVEAGVAQSAVRLR